METAQKRRRAGAINEAIAVLPRASPSSTARRVIVYGKVRNQIIERTPVLRRFIVASQAIGQKLIGKERDELRRLIRRKHAAFGVAQHSHEW